MQDPRHDPTPRLTHRGWKARKYLLLPVEGEKLSLTSPLIDQALHQLCAPVSFGGTLPTWLRMSNRKHNRRSQDVEARQRIIVFPETVQNEARFWRKFREAAFYHQH
jgi:hypothetical protein